MAYLGRKGQTAPLTSGDIPDGIIVAADLAPNSVDSDQYVDASIDTAHLASNIAISTSGAITTTGAFTSIGIDDNANALAITIDADEKVGIGSTPETDWYTSRTALHIGGNMAISATTSKAAGSRSFISNNIYLNTSGNWTAMSTDEGSMVELQDGKVILSGSNSVTGGTTATMNVGLQINKDGLPNMPNLGSTSGTDLVIDGSNDIYKKSSSKRYKKEIKNIDLGLEFINKLKPVKFKLNEKTAADGKDQVGLIAEDVELIEKRLVHYSKIDLNLESIEENMQVESVDYSAMSAPIIKAIQELSAKVTALETANTALEARVLALESA